MGEKRHVKKVNIIPIDFTLDSRIRSIEHVLHYMMNYNIKIILHVIVNDNNIIIK